jgi:septal ring factor EnvC (AmiA/AmiB activator)
MSLTERSRSVLYRRLNDIIGDEEAVGEMLAHFPANEADRPASEAFVAAQIAGVRTEIADVRTQIADVRTDVRTEIADVRTEIAGVRTEAAEREQRLMAFVHQEVRSSMRWTLGFLVSSQAVLVTAVLAAG